MKNGSHLLAEAGGLQDISNIDSTPVPAGEPRRISVGETLRAAREAAGMDIKQLALSTRVTVRHLEALEAGDYAVLPGRPYALGFARTYARVVGLDDKAITDGVREELDRQAPAPPPRVINQFEVGDPAKTPSRLTVWLAVGLVVVIALAGMIFWRSYYLPSADLPSLIAAEDPAGAPSQVAVVPLPAASPSGPVVFTATEDRIWVKFYDSQGQQILQKELSKGETFTVPSGAQEPRLWTGRPDALAITVGGQAVPRIAEREGIVKDVPVTAAALLARGTNPVASPSASPSNTQQTSAPKLVPTAARPSQARNRPVIVRDELAAPVAAPVNAVESVVPAQTVPASTQLN